MSWLERSAGVLLKVGSWRRGWDRIYTESRIPNVLNGSRPTEAIETTESLDGRTPPPSPHLQERRYTQSLDPLSVPHLGARRSRRHLYRMPL